MAYDVRRAARDVGMRPMWEDGLEKARLGVTTLEEVIAVAAGTLESDTTENLELHQGGGDDKMRLSA